MASQELYYSIDFSGKLVTVCEPMILKPGDFTILQNVRYVPNGYGGTTLRGIGGITKVNGTAPTTYTIFKSGFHYRKDQPSESHLLVQALDTGTAGRILDNTTTITGSETGNFSATALYSLTNTATGSFNKLPDSCVGFCNGYDSLVYSGNESRVGNFTVLDYAEYVAGTADYASYDGTVFVNNNLTTESITMKSYSSICSAWIASPRPISGIKFYVGTANTSAAAAPTIQYWNGSALAACTTIADGTRPGSIALAQSGTITFDSTVSVAKARMIFDNHAYWYLVQWTGLDAGTTVYCVTLKSPMQAFVDIWDGVPKSASQVWKQNTTATDEKFINYTTECLELDTKASGAGPGTYMVLSNLNTNDYVYIGSYFRLQGFNVKFAGKEVSNVDDGTKWGNRLTATLTVTYWNGSTWTAVSGQIDNTIGGKNNNASFNENGIVSWTAPAESLEYKTNIKNDFQLYYYRLQWNAKLDSRIRVDNIRVIPAAKTLHPYKYCFTFQGRTVLLNEMCNKKNRILISHPYSVCFFNGDNSFDDEVLDAESLVAGAPIHTRYSDNNFEDAIICSKDKTYLLTGQSSKTYKIIKISDVYGCLNPNTMKTCHLTLESGKQEVVIWLSQVGVVMYDGTKITRIDDDIRDKFTPNHANVIAYAGLLTMSAAFDERHNEYILYYPNSTNADAWVYNVEFNRWWFMRMVPATSGLLNCGFPVYDTNGSQYMFSGSSTGFLYRMNNGVSSDTANFTRTICTTDFPLPVPKEAGVFFATTSFEALNLYLKTSASADSITLTYYPDGSSTGITVKTFTQAHSGYAYKELRTETSSTIDTTARILHKLQLSLPSDDNAIGIEPLIMNIKYRLGTHRSEEPA